MMEGLHKGTRRGAHSSLWQAANWSMIIAQAAWMREGISEAAVGPTGKRIWTTDFRTSSSIA
jgi:hypothetical protein